MAKMTFTKYLQNSSYVLMGILMLGCTHKTLPGYFAPETSVRKAAPAASPSYTPVVAENTPEKTPEQPSVTPSSVPVTPPSDPATPPSVPVTPPSDPATPSVPVTPPSDPVTPPSVPVTPPSIPVTPEIVCGGLGGDTSGSTSVKDGLVATLSYLPEAPKGVTTLATYEKDATPVNAKLFFSQLNVPNHSFSEGFPLSEGGVLQNKGEPLIEWFSLNFDTLLKLAPGDRPGNYEFAVLSDDGSVIKIDKGLGMRTLINNDGEHEAKVKCSKVTVPMKASSLYPMHISYYQGPRYYIALVVMWRRVKTPEVLGDIQCGVIQPSIRGMLNRGWKVLKRENYQLPGVDAVNPCAKK